MEKIKLKTKAVLFALALGIISILVIALQREMKKEDVLVKLNASVAFDGSRILVSNNDTLDYLQTEMTVNGYYKITDMNLSAGETYTFWPVEFAHMNGNRLPAKQKPHQFAIWCGLNDGRNGYYSVRIKAD